MPRPVAEIEYDVAVGIVVARAVEDEVAVQVTPLCKSAAEV